MGHKKGVLTGLTKRQARREPGVLDVGLRRGANREVSTKTGAAQTARSADDGCGGIVRRMARGARARAVERAHGLAHSRHAATKPHQRPPQARGS
jgi:hypothetical protein